MMSFTKPQIRRSVLWVAAQITALLLITLIVPVSGAQAHDVLEGTTPANGSTVATMPHSIQMTFNNTPIAIGSEILIKDSTGKNWATGPVSIVDNLVTQDLNPGAPAGAFSVDWRIVSSDSHPIEGKFSFTVAGAGGSSAANSTAQAQSTTATNTKDDGGVPWGIVGGAAGLLIVIAALLVFARRRLVRSDEN